MALSDTPINHPHGIIVPSYGAGGTPSNRRRPDDAAKLGIHTTETKPGTGRNVAATLKTAYTGYVEFGTREYLQSLPLNWTAHSLRGGPGEDETNHSGVMHPQIAIVGYATDMQDLTSGDLDWFADVVVAPILELCGIPNLWVELFGEHDGIGPPWLASPESKRRFTYNRFYEFAGVYGHQNAPAPNDHWDPGKLNTGRLSIRLAAPVPPVAGPFDEIERQALKLVALIREAKR